MNVQPCHVDALIELLADVIRLAIRDYGRGPQFRHYHSARHFLHAAGLLEHVQCHLETDQGEAHQHSIMATGKRS